MKRIVICTLMVLLISVFAFSAFAAEGDFGYYDRNFDGVVEVTDALDVLKEVVNGGEETTLLHFIRTLKVSVSGEAVKVPIKTLNYDTKTATLLYSKGGTDYALSMSFSQLGFDYVSDITAFEEGFVTLTVPAPSADYLTSFDSKNVYAVKLEARYNQDVLECTVDSLNAKLNGVETELLYSAPTIRDGIFMINARWISDFFKADTTFDYVTRTMTYTVLDDTLKMVVDSTEAVLNGEKVIVPAPLTYIGSYLYVPAEFVVEALGGTVVFDDVTETMTISKYSYPTVYIEDNITTVSAGEEFVITVYLKHNPGIAGFQYYISYDSSVMSYVSGTGKISNMYTALSPDAGKNPVKFVAANLSLKDISGDLTTAEITFKVADDAAPGVYELNFDNFEAYDSNLIMLKTLAKAGTVVIE